MRLPHSHAPSPPTAETMAAIDLEADAGWKTSSALTATEPRSLAANSFGTRWHRRDGGLCCSAEARTAEDVGVSPRLEASASGYRTLRERPSIARGQDSCGVLRHSPCLEEDVVDCDGCPVRAIQYPATR